ncbi:VPS37-2 [Scenedesmus sp. PABB004]|nr:VPS37-2 [Scenedesmus sp. PABB004]
MAPVPGSAAPALAAAAASTQRAPDGGAPSPAGQRSGLSPLRWLTRRTPTNYDMLSMRCLARDLGGAAANDDGVAGLFFARLLPARAWWLRRVPGAARRWRAALEHRRLGAPGVVGFVDARTKWLDAVLARALAAGVDQVVVVAAGFGAAHAGVAFFEVDLPHASRAKAALVEELLTPAAAFPRPAFVPADLAATPLDAALLAAHPPGGGGGAGGGGGGARFDPGRPALFTVEGLVLDAPPGAVVPPAYAVTARAVASKGEPFVSGIGDSAAALAAFLDRVSAAEAAAAEATPGGEGAAPPAPAGAAAAAGGKRFALGSLLLRCGTRLRAGCAARSPRPPARARMAYAMYGSHFGSLERERNQQIEELARQFPACRAINQDRSVFDLPVELKDKKSTALRITLTPHFPQARACGPDPRCEEGRSLSSAGAGGAQLRRRRRRAQERPGVSVLVPVAHPAVDPTGRVHTPLLAGWVYGASRLSSVVAEAVATLAEGPGGGGDGTVPYPAGYPAPGPLSQGRANLLGSPGRPSSASPQRHQQVLPGPATSAALPDFSRFTAAQLEELMRDASAFKALLREAVRGSPMAATLEDIRVKNRQLAESNLSKQSAISEARNQLAVVRGSEYTLIKSRFDALYARQAKVLSVMGGVVWRERLEEAVSASDAASGALAADFLAGDLPLDDFVGKHVEARIAHHALDLKRQAAEALLAADGSAAAGGARSAHRGGSSSGAMACGGRRAAAAWLACHLVLALALPALAADQQAAAACPAASQCPFRVLALGDSLTLGAVPSAGSNHPYATRLQELLTTKFAGRATPSVTVAAYNYMGVFQPARDASGAPLDVTLLPLLRSKLADAAARGEPYAWVVVMAGVNDLGAGNRTAAAVMPRLAEAPNERERQRLVAAIRSAGAAAAGAAGAADCGAPRLHVLSLPPEWFGFWSMPAGRVASMQDDLLHLTPAGYDMLGGLVFNAISQATPLRGCLCPARGGAPPPAAAARSG